MMRHLGTAQRRLVFLILMATTLLLSACRQQKPGETVEGMVLDTGGKPVGEVRVFNSGDGPEPVETLTNSSGCFRLGGFNSGPVYVFAEKSDYRFAGLRTTAGATGVVIKLLRQTEPVSSQSVASESMPPDQQQKLARKMLERLRAEDFRGKQHYWVATAMSRIDPEVALRWSAESGASYADLIHAAVAEQIADDDLDEALSLIGQSGARSLDVLGVLARRYSVSDPAKAMRCVEELALRARAADLPWRVGYLAEAGSLVIQLGKKDEGRRLLDEAGRMAEKLRSDRASAFARGMTARAIAPSDLEWARRLLNPITAKDDRNEYLADVAVAACREDLDQSLEIAASLEEADRIRLRIAYRLAATRPADAIRVAEMIGLDPRPSVSAKGARASALGWVAVAIAPHDKPLACSLIDRAFVILMTPDKPARVLGIDGGWPAQAAFLAVQAKRIGYPDMKSVVDRALACRPSASIDPSPAHLVTSKVFMAALLGLVDPQTARDMLDSIEPCRAAIDSYIVRTVWVKAWLLADATRGQAVFDEEVASIRNKPGTDGEFYELVCAAELLAAAPHEKARYVSACPDFHSPEEER